ncbi:hypothetical protein KL864_31825 [Mycolicibacterium goodii]|uniref:hypothetical protein n=1 Tax=Mycolicibacterium goodii TaxID=134601 RepID=UPI001BDDB4D4|nr:hypothetical protein [Mycolicibacterium goodii]MBU8820466.1 hypothetical protein [Mycolicibacterium goodii]
MRVGDLFAGNDVETKPCVHCGEQAVDLGDVVVHFEVVADTGARTVRRECLTVVRGRRNNAGTAAEISSLTSGQDSK